jgi:carbon monoxide dehydrogenase subunit G
LQLAQVVERIAVSPACAWAVLTDFSRPHLIVPSIERCQARGDGVGATRTVYSSRGLRIDERVVECDEARLRFVYEALDSGDMPFDGIERYRATVTLAPEDDGVTVVWTADGTLSGSAESVRAFLEALYRAAIGRIPAASRRQP